MLSARPSDCHAGEISTATRSSALQPCRRRGGYELSVPYLSVCIHCRKEDTELLSDLSFALVLALSPWTTLPTLQNLTR